MDAQPLVLTAVLPPAEQAWLDGWREEFFPPERNHLAAHLTLFHALPGARREAIAAALTELAARTRHLPRTPTDCASSAPAWRSACTRRRS